MNIINIEHISKIFGGKTIFEDASCGVQEGEKTGIIGLNGTGKTTLLRLVAGLETPDEGQIITQNGIRMAYLSQTPQFGEEETVSSWAFTGDPNVDWKVQSNLNELGITDWEARIDTLSGGQKKRTAMAKVLADSFDVLLLDEPTNHLDQEMIGWLEEYLKAFRGTILMVTHDRYFLDKVTNRILEIDDGKIFSYEAGYSGFLEQKAAREEMELASERKRRSVLRMELEWAKRGCRARTTKQKARLERLEALKNQTGPVAEETARIDSVETRMGKKTVELHHVSKAYGEQILIRDFDYIFLKNQKVGIVGPNGCGKSTLLKIIAGQTEPDEGQVEVGETVRIAYFSQELPQMDIKQRVIDYVKDIGEYVQTKEGRITASQMLERFLFTPEMQYSPVEKLSGGEKKRLYLLGILQSNPNFLVLDECTNDLDIPTMTILEDYLSSFTGIVVTVSHDRYFLDNVADRIFEFSGNGTLTQYEGGYTDYIQARGQSVPDVKAGAGSDRKAEAGKEKDWKKPRSTKLKFSYKEQREYETIDEDIAALEEKIEKLDADIMANATNSVKLKELMEEKDRVQEELDEKMERWVYLTELAEKIAEQG
ncbi:ABC-F family ATP-binding cassette domain-containing protein [Lachnospiraceae bacterium DSM 108991]|uniref:ABC-F family ATP-binding cassette domain-containing protein n=1 Tax=Claveliimonas monacensis TaxID=2779351 RepID=A0ABR9RFY6_9FIRM|nr:ABC-F family ATP-binding cassette domain-containing protein [Claveliimonas monacensis]MBE5061886.1 ABC-F family ATP-binding cassette domain-containing protein [Claveliimonas monacensis]